MYGIIRVIVSKDYLVPLLEMDPNGDLPKARTAINGWALDYVAQDWFGTHAKTLYHATRDSYALGDDRNLSCQIIGLDQVGDETEFDALSRENVALRSAMGVVRKIYGLIDGSITDEERDILRKAMG